MERDISVHIHINRNYSKTLSMTYRPKRGPELNVKLVCDTLTIHDEIANKRACYIVANSVNRPQFRYWFMEKLHFITLIDYLVPPGKQLIEYKTRNGAVVRTMDPNMQADINLAAVIALTTLTNNLNEQGKLILIAGDIISKLLICYAMTTEDDVKNAALNCLHMYGVAVGHRCPTYEDESTRADTHYDYVPKIESKKERSRRMMSP